MISIRKRVRICNEDSPIFGREFIVKKVNEERLTVDLEDKEGNEITLPSSYVEEIDINTPKGSQISIINNTRDPELLFELKGALLDSNSNPNIIVINKLKELSNSYSVGIFNYDLTDPGNRAVEVFIDNYIPELRGKILVRNTIGENVKLIFSPRVIRVSENGTDFCPMCLISNGITSYSANIIDSMIRNTGDVQ